MKRLVTISALTALLASATATAATVHISVAPAAVAPGGLITVRAASSPCLGHDQVTLISSAFPGHAFGQGAVYGRVRAHGAFTVKAHLRSNVHAGRYRIGFRCGGGNLGVSAYVQVT
jgi:hypothetical protein